MAAQGKENNVHINTGSSYTAVSHNACSPPRNENANQPVEVLFLSDLDGTWLSKDPEQRKALDEGVLQLREEYRKQGIDLKFGYVTARPPIRVSQEGLPRQDYTITYNGGYIHPGPPGHETEDGYVIAPPLQEWDNINKACNFSTEEARQALDELLERDEFQGLRFQTVGEVVHQPQADANPYVASYCFDQDSIRLTFDEQADFNENGIPDIFETETIGVPDQLARLQQELDAALSQQGASHELSPVYPFRGKPIMMFDAAASTADKGEAVQFLMEHEGITPEHLIVAGDGGNDIVMMRAPDGTDDGRRAIVVGGERTLYDAAGQLRHVAMRPPEEDSSAGVLAGLRQHLQEIVSGLKATPD